MNQDVCSNVGIAGRGNDSVRNQLRLDLFRRVRDLFVVGTVSFYEGNYRRGTRVGLRSGNPPPGVAIVLICIGS